MRNSRRLSASVAPGHLALHFDGAAQCVHDATELDEQPVAGGFDQTALVFGDFRIDEFVARRFEALKVVLERLMIWVVAPGLDDRHDRLCVDKPRQVIDVAVRVVAVDAAAEPDDVANAQVVREDLLDGGPIKARIARLHVAE